MLDHVFLDTIAALRRAFENALLERQPVEERLQVDVLLGDLSWEGSFGLPGEGSPPRVRADVGLDWPTWSQAAYRSWLLGESPDEVPEIGVEIALRLQRLAAAPDVSEVLAVLADQAPPLGRERLERAGPTVEQAHDPDLATVEWAVEVTYDGTYSLEEALPARSGELDEQLAALGSWVASTLVRLGDLRLEFRPPDTDDEETR